MNGWRMHRVWLGVGALLWVACAGARAKQPTEPLARGEVYSVIELTFAGPAGGPADMPARDVEFCVEFRRDGGGESHTVQGFWDGDGRGGARGGVFRVRFCPTAPGKWTLAAVRSNRRELVGQHQGRQVLATAGQRAGFWLVDADSPGHRWYKRSDGSHPYIFGNTHYTFLSGRMRGRANPVAIADDVRANAEYFRKLRFGVQGGRYVNPKAKPWLDDRGRGTDDANYSCRPNPAWFHERVDQAVRTAWECDLIADLILSGPDTADARSALAAGGNRGDNKPYLRYMAARYGSYPNVWFCLANEWDIKRPKHTAREIIAAGRALRGYLAYPCPISVHGNHGDWDTALNAKGAWNDHVILQGKIRTLGRSADFMVRNHRRGGGDRPVVNDELGYEGKGDRFSRDDVIEGHLGALVGGGYGTTGYKPVAKQGHYFWGAFKPSEHTAAAHLKWLREQIERNVTFWRMAPAEPAKLRFSNLPPGARAMAWPGREMVLATSKPQKGVTIRLSAGMWRVVQYDAIAMRKRELAAEARGTFRFDVPKSRAAWTHFRKQP